MPYALRDFSSIMTRPRQIEPALTLVCRPRVQGLSQCRWPPPTPSLSEPHKALFLSAWSSAQKTMGTVFSILSCGTLTEDSFLFASVRALYVSAWRPRSDLRLS
ncbi:hypothetical protein ARMSODRAFT_369306 [Armillaria solidipes]|uniref:Uncharacterized protein n=1 Tax=Armillaria solidipes TaxID=1076256 RepID=A0A2H3B5F9_9AGAR|nr:hypothetical protein ARMSODRAFT_369306 [Armillaria solidipes]